jgi:anthranilate synthase component I
VASEPSFDAFAQAWDAGRPQVVWTRLIDDLETPVSAYLKIARGRPYAFLFESVEGGAWRGRYSIVAMKPDLVWRCRGDLADIAEGEAIAAGVFTPQAGGALDSLRDLIAASRIELPAGLPPPSAGVYGTLGYDMIRLAEKLPNVNPDPLGLPDAVMIRPSIVAVFDAIAQEIVLVTPARPVKGLSAKDAWDAANARLDAVLADLRAPMTPPVPGEPEEVTFSTPVSRADYADIVDRTKGFIEAGDIFQAVVAHRFRAAFRRDPFALYRSLRRTNPSPFLFYLEFGDFQLVGSSPEILVRLRDGKVTIRPIAGTRPRGETPERDLALEQELLADPKERAEHLMLIDLARNDLGRISRVGSVKVTDRMVIEKYSHVQHIVSNVEGMLVPDLDAIDVLRATFPAGTLTGAPKVRAMEIIDELEPVKRGIYGGACGYLSWSGEMDVAIAIRTGVLKDGVLNVQAAAGVVYDSVPEAEFQETEVKARAVLRAAELVEEGFTREL